MLSKPTLFISLCCLSLLTACSQVSMDYKNSKQYHEGKFHNANGIKGGGVGKLPSILWDYMTVKRIEPEPVKPVPVKALTPDVLANPDKQGITLYRLGHSSFLLNLLGEYWLIDPVFSQRASPVGWAGPKRYHQPPIKLEQLPKLAGIIISHDHYDHLDYITINMLADKVDRYLVPLGVAKHLRKWGIKDASIKELDWWQSYQHKNLTLTATPAQHFSGRSLNDGNETLWASWVIKAGDTSIFYSGDSGYFDGFKTIGERFGPFDLTLLENGAYDKKWPDIHMVPEQTLQAHLDLRGKAMMPVHNGTFDLAMHPWYEPFERISALAKQHNIPLITPIAGQGIDVKHLNKAHTSSWWREIMVEGKNDE